MIRRLFIDIETTGLPRTKGFDNYHHYSSLYHYNPARMVSMAWILHDPSNKIKMNRILMSNDMIIKPDFIIPDSKFHNIKHKNAMNHGYDIKRIFNLFTEMLEESDELLAYNINFDYNILCSEMYRNEYFESLYLLEGIKKRCIMKECFDKGYNNNGKYMKLLDLYKKIFNKEFRAHNALEDTNAAFKIFEHVIRN